MAASAVTPREMTCFQPVEINVTQDGDMSRKDSTDVGHSVDAPVMCQKESSSETLNDDDNNCHRNVQDGLASPTESVGVDLSSAESKDTLDADDTNQGPNSEGTKCVPSYNQQAEGEKAKISILPDIDVMPSKSLFHTPDLFGSDVNTNPNVYWLSTEFARLISDKRKTVKTTEEMRKEIKAIGLGNVDLSSGKPKSVEEMMREYGLEPSAYSTLSRASMLGVKTAWMPKSKYSITNVSQNNDALYGSKTEADDVKTHGTSVDGEFDYMLRRHGSNSNFVNAASSRENTNHYADTKRMSRTPSFSYHDFKTTGSSTNLDSVTSSKPNLDIKRMEDRPINPLLYFQRERERLQRIDSVISRTPKTSFTNIPQPNPWDFTDNTLSALRGRRSSYLNVGQGLLYGDDEKDWGNSSPTRAYLQRQASMSSTKQYSPLSTLSQFQSHDNPVFRDSSNFSTLLSNRPYSRSAATPGKHATSHTSKSPRETSASTKLATKQSSPSQRSISKSLGEPSRGGYKATKMKSRQGKSSSSKPKSLDDVDKDDFIAKLMENYSNSHAMAESEMGLTSVRRDAISSWQESDDILRKYNLHSSLLYSEPISRQRNDTKVKKGKYKPYQQNVESMQNYSPDKLQNDVSALTLSRTNMPIAWPGSCDPGKYLLEDENCSPAKPFPESQIQHSSTRNSTDGKNSSIKIGSCQNPTTLTSYCTGTANLDSLAGGKSGIRGGETENFSSRMLNDSEDLAMDDSASHSTNSVGEPDLKTTQSECKPKVTKRRKSVVKKKSVKQK